MVLITKKTERMIRSVIRNETPFVEPELREPDYSREELEEGQFQFPTISAALSTLARRPFAAEMGPGRDRGRVKMSVGRIGGLFAGSYFPQLFHRWIRNNKKIGTQIFAEKTDQSLD
jgi:hypothetical protein